MTWKCWLVIAAHWAVLVAVLLVSRSCQKDWEMKDQGRVQEIARFQFLAKSSGEKAAIAIEDANDAERKVKVLEDEIAILTDGLQPVPHERCRVPIARRDRVIRKQAEAIDIRKATEDMLRDALLAQESQILNLETALSLQEERAEGWKKSAKNQRRDKILIGVGSAIGGAGIMALSVYAAGQLQ